MFTPSEPNNWAKTQAELRGYEEAQRREKEREKRETRRFWITTAITSVAALAAVAGVLFQFVLTR